VRTERRRSGLRVHGVGLRGLAPARTAIQCGNSGTTMRLLAGLLAVQPFETLLLGDASLSCRPMQRIADPLAAMGARVDCLGPGGRPPLRVGGVTTVRGRMHTLPVESAQVRAALLLAGLFAAGPTAVRPVGASRDHTERLLGALGVRLRIDAGGILMHPTQPQGWSSFDAVIPGDLSSVAFHVVLAATTPGSRLQVRHVGLNPGRGRYLELLRAAGAQISWSEEGEMLGEPWGSIHVRGGRVAPLRIVARDVVACIDEIPALVAGWVGASSTIHVRDAGELRVKESDRIAGLAAIVRGLGGWITEYADGLDAGRSSDLHPGHLESRGDHRLAMAAAVLALCTRGTSVVADTACVRTSYPDFAADVTRLARPVRTATGMRSSRSAGVHSARGARKRG